MFRQFNQSRWLRIIASVIGVLIIWLVLLGAEIYRYSFENDALSADAAIVLGAAVWNGQPSPVLKERVNHAIKLYQANRVKFIIFTGGTGDNDSVAESIAASQYALAHGVAAKDMFCETSSKITWENLQGAKQLIIQQGLQRVLIVSDPLHSKRSIIMARDLGLNAYPSPTLTTRYTGFQSQMKFLGREVYFYALYLLQKPFMPFLENSQNRQVQACSVSNIAMFH